MSRGDQQDTRDELRREVGAAFIANLKRIREASGLSQENLSLRASLARTHVGKIEKAERSPKLDTVYRLAGALGVDPKELLGELYWRPSERAGHGVLTDEPPKERFKV